MEPSLNAPSAPPASPLFPLATPEGSTPWLSPRRLNQWIIAFVLLGLFARCVRYFLRFPLWEDECFLCVNLMDRDFRGLMGPLTFRQVAPLLFLWMQLAVIKVLGFNELSLRLMPFLAGLGNIILFWRLACRCLDGVPRLLAVAIFSVTYATIRYSAEAKPYGVDLFVALVLITFLMNWLQDPGRTRWLWVLAAAIPVAIGMSYGAVMLGGGLCLTIAWVIWRQRRWESVLPWAAYTGAMLLAFGGFYLMSIHTQEASDLAAMREMWKEHFPPFNGEVGWLQNTADFAYWMLHTHTGDILAYPAGGSPFQSSLSSLCWVAALIALLRRKQGTVLVMCLAPLAVTFVAALLRRFPYGGHVRLNLYMAPFMCLLIGYGLTMLLAFGTRWGWRIQAYLAGANREEVLLGFVGGRGWRPTPWLMTVLVILALVGGFTSIRDLSGPYKNISDERARAFAEWFWYNNEHDSEVVCVKTDLGLDFSPDTYRELCYSAEYLCNQRIYSPRRSKGEPIHLERVSATHPLRCVLYRCPSYSFDDQAFHAWLDEMQQTYELVGHETYPEVRLKNTGAIIGVDYLEIYRFVPRVAHDRGPGNAGTDEHATGG